MADDTKLTTGLPSLDEVLKGILPGDNIVWEVDDIEDYSALVQPYVRAAVAHGRRLIYFRFAGHRALVDAAAGAEIHELRPEDGFEAFLTRIHDVIEAGGRGAFYVFDCLSELVADWYSDQMLGNFFMLTCPYLFDLETITYFALFRNHHSADAIDPILQTTQLFLDVYRHDGVLHVRPIKVQHRYSATMHILHAWRDGAFKPVTSSADIAEIMASSPWSGLDTERRRGFWERSFARAHEVMELMKIGRCPSEIARDVHAHLVRMVLTREEGLMPLIAQHLTIDDLLRVRRRMIGTGLVGGKAVGMLLARAVLRNRHPRLAGVLEEHDSFFIGSDVFYTFLVRNGIWWARQSQRDPERFLEGAEQARRRILTGAFPDYVVRQIGEMLDYFGQSPVIVRSSSLLEDNYGNAFAGKYESVFCANQGPRERRLEDFLAAVRAIYASTMSERALRYRASRGLLERDEQMALLVMRVSGTLYGRRHFPAVAGVGFSFNPYVWNEHIDPRAGVVRLVFGLGTRAVDRVDDDYTRLVALNAPERRPESNFDEVREYAQHRVDFIDLEANHLASGYFEDLARDVPDLPLELFASTASGGAGDAAPGAVLTFDRLLKETPLVADLREMLAILEKAYGHPVDVEFTANFRPDGAYRVNLVQCRSLQVRGAETLRLPSVDVPPADRILSARGAVVGHSRFERVDRIVYVVPARYGELAVQPRHEIARLLGRINRAWKTPERECVMVIGPGRWGTSSPSLGIPVNFAEINRASVICEIVAMRQDLVPDVSLGTHFLNELVESDLLYLALFPEQGNNFIDGALLEGAPNRLAALVPSAEKWAEVVRVVDAADLAGPGREVLLLADAQAQRVVCYRGTAPDMLQRVNATS
jgi:hypothetical protein